MGHLSLPKECVTSGGLCQPIFFDLDTIWQRVTVHYRKSTKWSHRDKKNNDEQYGSGFNAVCVLMFWSHLGATVLIRKL